MSSFYSEKELESVGLRKYGDNVLISRNACIYGAENMVIGDNTRIDDFCVLSGKITLGDNIHIAPFCLLAGGEKGIVIKDFAGLSSRVSLYATSDDYSGESLTNPTIGRKYKKIESKEIIIEKHVIIGAASVILPGVKLGEGTAIGALSLITKNTVPWTIYAGNPCREIKKRSQNILNIEKQFWEDRDSDGNRF
jgi:acetyltransferase-like isoleucine patch superfamily enzyme